MEARSTFPEGKKLELLAAGIVSAAALFIAAFVACSSGCLGAAALHISRMI